MNEQRDFKGIWIPKEIWLNSELTLLEKIIFIEIDSLDNENHCVASNEYFANFCGCSESKISKAIKKLESLEMIQVMNFDGRHRKLRVVKKDSLPSKKGQAASYKVRPNNIDSKIENKKNNSKELLENFEFGSKSREPKLSLYSKCVAEINSRGYTKHLHDALVDYLDVRLQMKDKPLYANSWKGLLNKLERDFTEDERIGVVFQSIERGYASFFPVSKGWNNSNSQKDKPWEKGVTSRKMTKQEEAEHEKWLADCRAKGIQVDY